MMKNTIVLALCALLGLSILTGCKNNAAVGNGGGEAAAYTLKYAHNQREDSPQGVGAIAFQEKAEELSGGRIRIEVYPNGQLGSLRELIESVQGGDIEITQQPTSMIGNFIPQTMITDLPWLYESEEHMWNAMNGEAGEIINNLMPEAGFVNLGYMHGGAKVFTTKNTPVEQLTDFAGLQLRAMPSPIVVDTFKSLGANPVPLEFSELYNALQQGVVDGQENPNQTTYMNNYHEVQSYTVITEHAFMIYANVINRDLYESMPEDLQAILVEAMGYAAEIERDTINGEDAMYIETCEANGMEFITPTPQALQEMKDATRQVWEANRDDLGADFYDAFVAAVESAK